MTSAPENLRIPQNLVDVIRQYNEEHHNLKLHEVSEYLQKRGYNASRPEVEAAITIVTMDPPQSPSRAKH